MTNSTNLQQQVSLAVQESNISSVLFRNAVGRKLGLNITDTWCLTILLMKGALTPTELARYTGLTTGSTTAMLDRLEKAELIFRRPNPDDRRGSIVGINDKTAAIMQPLVEDLQKAQLQLFATYNDDQLAVIADFLTRFAANVQDATAALDHGSK